MGNKHRDTNRQQGPGGAGPLYHGHSDIIISNAAAGAAGGAPGVKYAGCSWNNIAS